MLHFFYLERHVMEMFFKRVIITGHHITDAYCVFSSFLELISNYYKCKCNYIIPLLLLGYLHFLSLRKKILISAKDNYTPFVTLFTFRNIKEILL